MRGRLRAVFSLVVILFGFAALPAAAPAGAEPRTVTVTTMDIAPFVMTQWNQRSGLTIDLWEEIAKRQQWSTQYIGADTVAGQLKDIADRRADVAAAAISSTEDRALSYDFSQPIMEGGLQILIPERATDQANPALLDFLPLLFSVPVLLLLLSAVGLAVIPAHIAWLVERRRADSKVSKSWGVGWSRRVLSIHSRLSTTEMLDSWRSSKPVTSPHTMSVGSPRTTMPRAHSSSVRPYALYQYRKASPSGSFNARRP